MPVRALPPNPSLTHLKYQARDLLKGIALRDRAAAQRIREFHPNWANATDSQIFGSRLRLADAQLAIAREYGFASWTRLKRRIEKPEPNDDMRRPYQDRIGDPVFRAGVQFVDAGDLTGLREHLRKHPDLVRQRVEFEGGNYFRNPTLLEFIAENPIRRGKLPDNILEITKMILDAGPELSSINDALILVATGSVARECGQQISLIRLLCERGADPNCAVEAAAAHGELQALAALRASGAHPTLAFAASSGEYETLRSLLPASGSRERHLALALAAQYGHVLSVEILLDAGEDPNRFNPTGAHSHSTPLHEAAFHGHLDVVKILVQRGAKLDTKDILFGGTALDWAKNAGRTNVEEFLRSKMHHEVRAKL